MHRPIDWLVRDIGLVQCTGLVQDIGLGQEIGLVQDIGLVQCIGLVRGIGPGKAFLHLQARLAATLILRGFFALAARDPDRCAPLGGPGRFARFVGPMAGHHFRWNWLEYPGPPRILMAPSLAQRLDRSLAALGTTTLIPVGILALAWGQELLDALLFRGHWNLPMVQGGSLLGVLTAPFSHSGFGHLISNSIAFLPLSWLVLMRGRRDYWAVWIGVYAMAVPVWLWWPGGSHGLSGVIYGLLGYLLVIGWLEKRFFSILLSLFAVMTFGGMLPALLPFLSPAGVSWIGHASGFVGGMLAALATYRETSPRL